MLDAADGGLRAIVDEAVAIETEFADDEYFE
jgi:hypothetical protein